MKLMRKRCLSWFLAIVMCCCSGDHAVVFVGAFPTQAGSCDGVGGYHLVDYDQNVSRNIQSYSSLRDHGLELTANGVPLIEKSENVVNVIEFTIDNNYTVQLNVTSISQLPFRGALIRVQPAASSVVNNNTNASLVLDDDTIFLLEALSENAQVSSLCYDSNAQAVTHTDNLEKLQVAAVLTHVSLVSDEIYWTIDITIVEANNATASIYSYAQYQVLSQGTEDDTNNSTTTTPSPTISVISKPPFNATTSPLFSENTTASNETTSTATPTPRNSSTTPPPTTTVVTAVPISSSDQVLRPPGALFTFAPTETYQPTATIYPTVRGGCDLCGGTSSVSVNQQITLFDAVVVFYDTAITCRELARTAHRLAATPCRVATLIAQTGCGCLPVDGNSTTTFPPVTNAPTHSLPPTISPYTATPGEEHNSPHTACVLCPIIHADAEIVNTAAGTDTVVQNISCRDVELDPRLIVSTLLEVHPSCAQVQQVVATSCGCILAEDEAPSSTADVTILTSNAPTTTLSVVLSAFVVVVWLFAESMVTWTSIQ